MKIVFIDIDGTIINSNYEITDRTKQAIAKLKEKGVESHICTGRPRWHANKYANEASMGRFLISTTGGEVYDRATNQVLYQKQMDTKSLLKLLEIARKYDIETSFQAGYDIYTNKRSSPDHEYRILLSNNAEELFNTAKVTQVLFKDKDIEKIKQAKEEILAIKDVKIINQLKYLVYPNRPYNPEKDIAYLDVATPETSKGNAVKFLCEYLNIDLKDCVCIGDSLNDISMLKVAGTAIAMENATDDVKAVADHITSSNNNDGVAKFIEEYLL